MGRVTWQRWCAVCVSGRPGKGGAMGGSPATAPSVSCSCVPPLHPPRAAPPPQLFKYIVRKRRLREADACRLFHDIVDGVDYLHSVGVIHRDLKPENLLMRRTKDGRYRIKVIDFGLSNIQDPGKVLKTACGSPCYAAPEMIKGYRYDGTRSDWWSLGVVLFAMVAGYLPFEDANTSALYDKILHARYTFPTWLSAPCKDLISRMLNTDPKARFTAGDIRRHAWYSQVSTIPPGVTPFPASLDQLDDRVVRRVTDLGIDLGTLRQSVERASHNHATTTYYLVALRMEAKGELGSAPVPAFTSTRPFSATPDATPTPAQRPASAAPPSDDTPRTTRPARPASALPSTRASGASGADTLASTRPASTLHHPASDQELSGEEPASATAPEAAKPTRASSARPSRPASGPAQRDHSSGGDKTTTRSSSVAPRRPATALGALRTAREAAAAAAAKEAATSTATAAARESTDAPTSPDPITTHTATGADSETSPSSTGERLGRTSGGTGSAYSTQQARAAAASREQGDQSPPSTTGAAASARPVTRRGPGDSSLGGGRDRPGTARGAADMLAVARGGAGPVHVVDLDSPVEQLPATPEEAAEGDAPGFGVSRVSTGMQIESHPRNAQREAPPKTGAELAAEAVSVRMASMRSAGEGRTSPRPRSTSPRPTSAAEEAVVEEAAPAPATATPSIPSPVPEAAPAPVPDLPVASAGEREEGGAGRGRHPPSDPDGGGGDDKDSISTGTSATTRSRSPRPTSARRSRPASASRKARRSASSRRPGSARRGRSRPPSATAGPYSTLGSGSSGSGGGRPSSARSASRRQAAAAVYAGREAPGPRANYDHVQSSGYGQAGGVRPSTAPRRFRSKSPRPGSAAAAPSAPLYSYQRKPAPGSVDPTSHPPTARASTVAAPPTAAASARIAAAPNRGRRTQVWSLKPGATSSGNTPASHTAPPIRGRYFAGTHRGVTPSGTAYGFGGAGTGGTPAGAVGGVVVPPLALARMREAQAARSARPASAHPAHATGSAVRSVSPRATAWAEAHAAAVAGVRGARVASAGPGGRSGAAGHVPGIRVHSARDPYGRYPATQRTGESRSAWGSQGNAFSARTGTVFGVHR